MRTPRERSIADIYHVVARGVGRQIIFECDEDRLGFLKAINRCFNEGGCTVYAWCLMSNHVHLLVKAPIEVLSAALARALSIYAIGFNSKYERVGHLFQDRFSSEPVNDDAYLLTVIRYIHQNPVKAGLSKIDGYPWSSYNEYIGWNSHAKSISAPGFTGLCEISFPLAIFGGIDAFKRFHAAGSNDSCLDVRSGRSATKPMPDELAIRMAREALGPVRLQDVKALEPYERNCALLKLRHAGLTVRQIERLTGIGRGIIQRAK